jgi:Rad3-related DNA helicase
LPEVNKAAKMFDGFLEDSYVTFTKKDGVLITNIVTTNLAKRFKDMAEKNKIIVLMSGTLHSKEVLRDIFGIEDFKVIEAEVQQQGQIGINKTGLEMDCKYSNFSSGKNSREDYLIALDKSIEISKKPTLVHVNSFADLPSTLEKRELELKNLIDKEELREIQVGDGSGRLIQEFKEGKKNVLFSTRASRGIDFPGKECNSIVFTKYPNPNVQDAFWKILSKTNPSQYWNFYKDKAKRELLQKVYRGLRFNEDHVDVLSPDSRVLDFFKN